MIVPSLQELLTEQTTLLTSTTGDAYTAVQQNVQQIQTAIDGWSGVVARSDNIVDFTLDLANKQIDQSIKEVYSAILNADPGHSLPVIETRNTAFNKAIISGHISPAQIVQQVLNQGKELLGLFVV